MHLQKCVKISDDGVAHLADLLLVTDVSLVCCHVSDAEIGHPMAMPGLRKVALPLCFSGVCPCFSKKEENGVLI